MRCTASPSADFETISSTTIPVGINDFWSFSKSENVAGIDRCRYLTDCFFFADAWIGVAAGGSKILSDFGDRIEM